MEKLKEKKATTLDEALATYEQVSRYFTNQIEKVGDFLWLDAKMYDTLTKEEKKQIFTFLIYCGFRFSKNKQKFYFAEHLKKCGYYKKPTYLEIKQKYGVVPFNKLKDDEKAS